MMTFPQSMLSLKLCEWPSHFVTWCRSLREDYMYLACATPYLHCMHSSWERVAVRERWRAFYVVPIEVLRSICSNTRLMKRTVNVYFAVTELRSKIVYWLQKGSNFALVRSLIAIERTYEQSAASSQFSEIFCSKLKTNRTETCEQ